MAEGGSVDLPYLRTLSGSSRDARAAGAPSNAETERFERPSPYELSRFERGGTTNSQRLQIQSVLRSALRLRVACIDRASLHASAKRLSTSSLAVSRSGGAPIMRTEVFMCSA